MAAHTAGGAGGVQGMGPLVGAPVESVVVGGFVDAHPPQHDGGVVVVGADHLLQAVEGGVLPGRAADVLPAGHLLEHQKAQFITPVQKMAALGVVAGAHHVGPQPTHKVGVPALYPPWHSVAHIGKALVAVESHQLAPAAVEIEAVGPEFAQAEAEAGAPLVQRLPVPHQPGPGCVQGRVLGAPAAQRGGVCEQHPGRRAPRLHRGRGLQPRARAQNLHLQQGVPVQGILQLGAHRQLSALRRAQGGDGQAPNSLGAGHHQGGLPVDAAVGEVVHHVAAGGKIGPFGGIHLHHQAVFTGNQQIRQLYPEGGVASPVSAGIPAVAEHLGGGHHTLKFQEHPPARPGRRGVQHPQVAGDELVGPLVQVVVGQLDVGVGQLHLFARGRGAGGEIIAAQAAHKAPAAVQGDGFTQEEHVLSVELSGLEDITPGRLSRASRRGRTASR